MHWLSSKSQLCATSDADWHVTGLLFLILKGVLPFPHLQIFFHFCSHTSSFLPAPKTACSPWAICSLRSPASSYAMMPLVKRLSMIASHHARGHRGLYHSRTALLLHSQQCTCITAFDGAVKNIVPLQFRS